MTPNDELRALAQAEIDSPIRVNLVPHPDPQFAAFSDFRAAASPEAVIKLLDRIAELEKRCEELNLDLVAVANGVRVFPVF